MKWLPVVVLLLLAGCGTPRTAEKNPPCVCEDGCVEACSTGESTNTTYRTVDRASGSSPELVDSGEPFTPTDPVVAVAVLEGDAAAEALSDVGLDGAAHVFRGDFLRGGDDADVAAVHDDGTLEIRQSSGARHSEMEFGQVISVRPVSLIDDRLELAVRHRDARGVLRFTIVRPIGGALARVLTVPLKDSDGRQLHTVEFVERGGERAVRVTPDDGTPQIHRWNEWEGMFRVPKVPPTAPPR